MKKHINIPIFIPHLGCGNECVFCNQRKITGVQKFDFGKVKDEIENGLSTKSPDTIAQIAYFGGSFTGIEREAMVQLLEIAYGYVLNGRVDSIRLSTRPDYINEEILDILSKYGVKTVELGIQSISDKVLEASKRGNTASDCINSMMLVKQYGFELIGQMMIGLPQSDLQSELETAKAICDCKADGARIYPTVVFCDTKLAQMAQDGLYNPPNSDDMLNRTKRVKKVFIENNVATIRIGLQSTDNLYDKGTVAYGEYDNAIGERCEAEIYYDILCDKLSKIECTGKLITVFAPKNTTSKVIGQRKINKERIIQKYKIKDFKVIEKDFVKEYTLELDN